MLSRLANLIFRREPEPQTDLVTSALTTVNAGSVELEESLAAARDALKRFMRLVTAHLDAVEGRRLTEVVLTYFDEYEDSGEAVEEGLLGDKGQRRGQWLVIQCDWKASEEVEWQVSEVAASFGLADRWSWGGITSTESRTVPTGLCDAARWASPLGLEMLHLDLGGDAYYSVMVRCTDANDACQAAAGAGLNVLRTPEFEKLNG